MTPVTGRTTTKPVVVESFDGKTNTVTDAKPVAKADPQSPVDGVDKGDKPQQTSAPQGSSGPQIARDGAPVEALNPDELLARYEQLVTQYEQTKDPALLKELHATGDQLSTIGNRYARDVQTTSGAKQDEARAKLEALDAKAGPLFQRAQVLEASHMPISPADKKAGYKAPGELLAGYYAGMKEQAEAEAAHRKPHTRADDPDIEGDVYNFGRALQIQGITQQDIEYFLLTGQWTDNMMRVAERAMKTGEWTAQNAYTAILYLEASTLRARKYELQQMPQPLSEDATKELAAIDKRLPELRRTVNQLNRTASDMRTAGGEKKLEDAKRHEGNAADYEAKAAAAKEKGDAKEEARLQGLATKEKEKAKRSRDAGVKDLQDEGVYLGGKIDRTKNPEDVSPWLRSRAGRAWNGVASGQIDAGKSDVAALRDQPGVPSGPPPSIAGSDDEIKGKVPPQPPKPGQQASALYAIDRSKVYDPEGADSKELKVLEKGAYGNIAAYQDVRVRKQGYFTTDRYKRERPAGDASDAAKNDRDVYWTWRNKEAQKTDEVIAMYGDPPTFDSPADAITYSELQRDKGAQKNEKAEIYAADVSDERELKALETGIADQQKSYDDALAHLPKDDDHSAEAELARRNLKSQKEGLEKNKARYAELTTQRPASHGDAARVFEADNAGQPYVIPTSFDKEVTSNIAAADQAYYKGTSSLDDEVKRQEAELPKLKGEKKKEALAILDYTKKMRTEADFAYAGYLSRSAFTMDAAGPPVGTDFAAHSMAMPADGKTPLNRESRGAAAAYMTNRGLDYIDTLPKDDPYKQAVLPQGIEMAATVGEVFVVEVPVVSKKLFDRAHDLVPDIKSPDVKKKMGERVAVAPMRALDTLSARSNESIGSGNFVAGVPEDLLAQARKWQKEIDPASKAYAELKIGLDKYDRILRDAAKPAQLAKKQMLNGDKKAEKLALEGKQAYDDLVDAAISDLGNAAWDAVGESPEEKHMRLNREEYDSQKANMERFSTDVGAQLDGWVKGFEAARDGDPPRGLTYLMYTKAASVEARFRTGPAANYDVARGFLLKYAPAGMEKGMDAFYQYTAGGSNIPTFNAWVNGPGLDPQPVLDSMGDENLAFMSGPASYFVNEQFDRLKWFKEANGWAVYASAGADILWSVGISFVLPEFLPGVIARLGAVGATVVRGASAIRGVEAIVELGATVSRVIRTSRTVQTLARIVAFGGRMAGFGAARATAAARWWAAARQMMFIGTTMYGAQKASASMFGKYSGITKAVNIFSNIIPIGAGNQVAGFARQELKTGQAMLALAQHLGLPTTQWALGTFAVPKAFEALGLEKYHFAQEMTNLVIGAVLPATIGLHGERAQMKDYEIASGRLLSEGNYRVPADVSPAVQKSVANEMLRFNKDFEGKMPSAGDVLTYEKNVADALKVPGALETPQQQKARLDLAHEVASTAQTEKAASLELVKFDPKKPPTREQVKAYVDKTAQRLIDGGMEPALAYMRAGEHFGQYFGGWGSQAAKEGWGDATLTKYGEAQQAALEHGEAAFLTHHFDETAKPIPAELQTKATEILGDALTEARVKTTVGGDPLPADYFPKLRERLIKVGIDPTHADFLVQRVQSEAVGGAIGRRITYAQHQKGALPLSADEVRSAVTESLKQLGITDPATVKAVADKYIDGYLGVDARAAKVTTTELPIETKALFGKERVPQTLTDKPLTGTTSDGKTTHIPNDYYLKEVVVLKNGRVEAKLGGPRNGVNLRGDTVVTIPLHEFLDASPGALLPDGMRVFDANGEMGIVKVHGDEIVVDFAESKNHPNGEETFTAKEFVSKNFQTEDGAGGKRALFPEKAQKAAEAAVAADPKAKKPSQGDATVPGKKQPSQGEATVPGKKPPPAQDRGHDGAGPKNRYYDSPPADRPPPKDFAGNEVRLYDHEQLYRRGSKAKEGLESERFIAVGEVTVHENGVAEKRIVVWDPVSREYLPMKTGPGELMPQFHGDTAVNVSHDIEAGYLAKRAALSEPQQKRLDAAIQRTRSPEEQYLLLKEFSLSGSVEKVEMIQHVASELKLSPQDLLKISTADGIYQYFNNSCALTVPQYALANASPAEAIFMFMKMVDSGGKPIDTKLGQVKMENGKLMDVSKSPPVEIVFKPGNDPQRAGQFQINAAYKKGVILENRDGSPVRVAEPPKDPNKPSVQIGEVGTTPEKQVELWNETVAPVTGASGYAHTPIDGTTDGGRATFASTLIDQLGTPGRRVPEGVGVRALVKGSPHALIAVGAEFVPRLGEYVFSFRDPAYGTMIEITYSEMVHPRADSPYQFTGMITRSERPATAGVPDRFANTPDRAGAYTHAYADPVLRPLLDGPKPVGEAVVGYAMQFDGPIPRKEADFLSSAFAKSAEKGELAAFMLRRYGSLENVPASEMKAFEKGAAKPADLPTNGFDPWTQDQFGRSWALDAEPGAEGPWKTAAELSRSPYSSDRAIAETAVRAIIEDPSGAPHYEKAMRAEAEWIKNGGGDGASWRSMLEKAGLKPHEVEVWMRHGTDVGRARTETPGANFVSAGRLLETADSARARAKKMVTSKDEGTKLPGELILAFPEGERVTAVDKKVKGDDGNIYTDLDVRTEYATFEVGSGKHADDHKATQVDKLQGDSPANPAKLPVVVLGPNMDLGRQMAIEKNGGYFVRSPRDGAHINTLFKERAEARKRGEMAPDGDHEFLPLDSTANRATFEHITDPAAALAKEIVETTPVATFFENPVGRDYMKKVKPEFRADTEAGEVTRTARRMFAAGFELEMSAIAKLPVSERVKALHELANAHTYGEAREIFARYGVETNPMRERATAKSGAANVPDRGVWRSPVDADPAHVPASRLPLGSTEQAAFDRMAFNEPAKRPALRQIAALEPESARQYYTSLLARETDPARVQFLTDALTASPNQAVLAAHLLNGAPNTPLHQMDPVLVDFVKNAGPDPIPVPATHLQGHEFLELARQSRDLAQQAGGNWTPELLAKWRLLEAIAAAPHSELTIHALRSAAGEWDITRIQWFEAHVKSGTGGEALGWIRSNPPGPPPAPKQAYTPSPIQPIDVRTSDAVLGAAVFPKRFSAERPTLDSKQLKNAGLAPEFYVKVDGADIYLSKSFDLGGGRVGVVGYVSVDGGPVQARMFYRSNSETTWKVVEVDDGGRYAKSWDENAINLSLPLSAALFKHEQNKATLMDPMTGRPAESQAVVADSISHGLMKDLSGAFKPNGGDVVIEMKSLSKNSFSKKVFSRDFAAEVSRQPLELLPQPEGQIRRLDDHMLPDPKKVKLPPEHLLPDFSKPVDSFSWTNERYGKSMGTDGTLTGTIYLSKDGSLSYMFVEDSAGHATLVQVETRDSKTTSFGVRKERVSIEGQGAALIEYSDQVAVGYPAPPKLPGAKYVSNWNYVSALPMTQYYYRAQGRTPPP